MNEQNDIVEMKEELNVEIYETGNIKNLIYCIRGKQVMLDSDVAMLYQCETRIINQAVKRNIDRFPERFCFRLTQSEVENLKSQFVISSLTKENYGGRRYSPYVFTEQGIYMLMTVLRGDLAIKQSRALVRTFKRMKDFIIENQNLIGQREYLQLSMQVSDNIRKTLQLRMDLNEVEERMADVMDRLSEVVVRSDLSSGKRDDIYSRQLYWNKDIVAVD